MSSDRTQPTARHHLGTLKAMGIEPRAEAADTPVVVDAMVGYGLAGPLRGRAAALAR
jgi:NAD(P)H-hydrate repair Nnr-like enzyme with NAD(P)H-hydrate epimerase domain